VLVVWRIWYFGLKPDIRDHIALAFSISRAVY